jgi:hypothetical protein
MVTAWGYIRETSSKPVSCVLGSEEVGRMLESC